ncbi:protein rolling stone-like [Liolophura sinensis]|uniref:protein rolling stone-like n=1 Tax=Liolophura sinensis TaxID=3198878 RepID=UPI0031592100
MASPGKVFRSEFRLKHFGFSSIAHERVFFSQWRWPPLVVIGYKLVLTGYTDFWLGYTASANSSIGDMPWGVWLTNWTYTLLALHLTTSTIALTVYHIVQVSRSRSWLCSKLSDIHGDIVSESGLLAERGNQGRETTVDASNKGGARLLAYTWACCDRWYVVLIWILFDMANVAVPMVTFMFFVFLWPAISGSEPISNENLQLHGISCVLMLIDFALSAVPIRLLHMIYPLIYGLIYVVFSAIYWGVDHSHVMYPGILDWNSPGTTIAMVFAVIAIMCTLQVMLLGLHKLKLLIYNKIYNTDVYESSSGMNSYDLNQGST